MRFITIVSLLLMSGCANDSFIWLSLDDDRWAGSSQCPQTSYSFSFSFGSAGAANGQFSMPTDIAIDSNSNVFVVDRGNDRIQKFNASGTYLTKWGATGAGDSQFSSPTGIDVDDSNRVYVVDTGNDRVQVFNEEGQFLSKWGSTGTGIDQYTTPYDVAIRSNNDAWVSDTSPHTVSPLGGVGVGGLGSGNNQFNTPDGLAWGRYLYIVDSLNHRIQAFDDSYGSSAFQSVLRFGQSGSNNGEFSAPRDVAISPAVSYGSENIYVADTFNHRIQKFNSQGGFITTFGSSGAGAGQFTQTRGVAVAADCRVYASDYLGSRINVFVAN